jgi:hypothetical protein
MVRTASPTPDEEPQAEGLTTASKRPVLFVFEHKMIMVGGALGTVLRYGPSQ